MEKVRISFFKELYYWTYFYYSITIEKISAPPKLPFGASIILAILRLCNFVSVWIFIECISKINGIKYEESISKTLFSICLFILLAFDWIYFPSKRDSIITTCEQFSKKRRIIGQIKFWVYAILTILFFQYVDGLRNRMG